MATDNSSKNNELASSGLSIPIKRQVRCRTVLVSDVPAKEDSFESNKAYKRIVEAILDIIRSEAKDGGLFIGVEGNWGAGKTTIINLLRKELRKSIVKEETSEAEKPIELLIAFDAWAHEGDPLRLTFL